MNYKYLKLILTKSGGLNPSITLPKEKKDKGYYIPNMYQVPKEWLEQRLGFKIKNA
jgi:16S rRNA U516 pseudouridylate synthase RsuA-like enzyme